MAQINLNNLDDNWDMAKVKKALQNNPIQIKIDIHPDTVELMKATQVELERLARIAGLNFRGVMLEESMRTFYKTEGFSIESFILLQLIGEGVYEYQVELLPHISHADMEILSAVGLFGDTFRRIFREEVKKVVIVYD